MKFTLVLFSGPLQVLMLPECPGCLGTILPPIQEQAVKCFIGQSTWVESGKNATYYQV